MDSPSSSLLSDASSAPPAQNELVIQEGQHDEKAAEKKELAVAQQRINALPMPNLLSIMRKALPRDAHIDAEVDEAIRACVAKFTGVLTKEAKQQQSLARHKALQSEDIINALYKLGFEDSSTALSLFFSRFRLATNRFTKCSYQCNSRAALLFLIKNNILPRQHEITATPRDTKNAGSLISDASSAPPAQNQLVIQEDQHDEETTEAKELAAAQQRIDALPMRNLLSIMRKALPKDAHIDADVDEAIRACVAKFTGVLTKEAKQQQSLARHKALQSEDIINALQKLGFEDSSIALSLFFSRFTLSTNRSQQLQLPVQQQGSITAPNQGIIRGDPTSSLQYWGNATMPPPPPPALPSNPQIAVNPDTTYLRNMQPPSAPMQQQRPVQWNPHNFASDSSFGQ